MGHGILKDNYVFWQVTVLWGADNTNIRGKPVRGDESNSMSIFPIDTTELTSPILCDNNETLKGKEVEKSLSRNAMRGTGSEAHKSNSVFRNK